MFKIFSDEKWAQVIDHTKKWWAGELGRPLIQVGIKGGKPDRDEPDLPYHS